MDGPSELANNFKVGGCFIHWKVNGHLEVGGLFNFNPVGIE